MHTLLLLLISLDVALCCNWLWRYAHINRDTLDLLDQMGGPLTDQESQVTFPSRLYKDIKKDKAESKLLFIVNSLDLILSLYSHGNLSSVSWDTKKTERFLDNIHRQTYELHSCLPTKRKPNIKLTRYYRRLRKNTVSMCVYHTGGSPASWELIRKETKHHLQRLELLVASMVAASGGRTALF
ncbi:interferon phi 1 [Genypterus blacodes]|uniref:interferon phi 1 n=1 Tax=Genypterus blacodes TaxID=154954 RepID=UPI003F771A86